jgi:hypothetical protein
MEEPEQDSQDGTAETGQAEGTDRKDCQHRNVRTGLLGKESKSRTVRTGQPEPPGYDCQSGCWGWNRDLIFTIMRQREGKARIRVQPFPFFALFFLPAPALFWLCACERLPLITHSLQTTGRLGTTCIDRKGLRLFLHSRGG